MLLFEAQCQPSVLEYNEAAAREASSPWREALSAVNEAGCAHLL